jgi:hypothetical protein
LVKAISQSRNQFLTTHSASLPRLAGASSAGCGHRGTQRRSKSNTKTKNSTYIRLSLVQAEIAEEEQRTRRNITDGERGKNVQLATQCVQDCPLAETMWRGFANTLNESQVQRSGFLVATRAHVPHSCAALQNEAPSSTRAPYALSE